MPAGRGNVAIWLTKEEHPFTPSKSRGNDNVNEPSPGLFIGSKEHGPIFL